MLAFSRRRAAGWASPPPPSRRAGRPFGFGHRCSRRRQRRGFGHRRSGAGRPASSAAPSGCCNRSATRRGRVRRALAVLRAQVPSHLGSHLAFGAQGAVRGMEVDPPHDDRGRRPADRGSLLGQRPAGVDRVARAHGTGKLPVEPFPFLDRGHRHVDRAEPDRHGDQERRRGYAGVPGGGLDGKGGEVARDPGEQRDLGFRNGAPPGGPFTT
jgi:hypothetical protein